MEIECRRCSDVLSSFSAYICHASFYNLQCVHIYSVEYQINSSIVKCGETVAEMKEIKITSTFSTPVQVVTSGTQQQ